MTGLEELEAQLQREREIFSYPAAPWTLTHEEDGEPVLDVLVVGAGQGGITTTARLRKEGVGRVLMVDRAPEGFEGPWITWARMKTLRTAKELHGVDNGLPSASFRSWYEAQHGADGYAELGLIPREVWAAYLRWVRISLELPLRSRTEVIDARPDGAHWLVTLRSLDSGTEETLRTRKIVATTGIDGAGGARIPGVVADSIPAERWAHSSHDIDFGALEGKAVAVLGNGASAFDNAAAALDAGAAKVIQYVRRDSLPEVNSLRFLEFRGLFRSFGTMPDDLRLAFTRKSFSIPIPPPPWSVERCTVHDNYELRFGSPFEAVREEDGAVVITTPKGEDRVDFVILATGFVQDVRRIPWLASVADQIMLWGDRVDLGTDPVDARIAISPYTKGGMQLHGLTPEADESLRDVHMFNYSSLASVGDVCIGNNGMAWGVELVVRQIVEDLFQYDAAEFYRLYENYDASEFALAPTLHGKAH